VEYKAAGSAYGCTLSWLSSSFSKSIIPSSRFWHPYFGVGSIDISVAPQSPDAAVSVFFGAGLSVATVGTVSTFCIHFKDTFGNSVNNTAALVTIGEMSDESGSFCWTSCSMSSCCVSSIFKVSGSRFLHLMFNNVPAQISPINILVHNGAALPHSVFLSLRWA
jgi:hypothetical protein